MLESFAVGDTDTMVTITITPEDYISGKISRLQGYGGAFNREIRDMKTGANAKMIKNWDSVVANSVITLLVPTQEVAGVKLRVLDGQNRIHIGAIHFGVPVKWTARIVREEELGEIGIANFVAEMATSNRQDTNDLLSNYRADSKLPDKFRVFSKTQPTYKAQRGALKWSHIAEGLGTYQDWERRGQVWYLVNGRANALRVWRNTTEVDARLTALAVDWWVQQVEEAATHAPPGAKVFRMRGPASIAFAIGMYKKYRKSAVHWKRLEKIGANLGRRIDFERLPSSQVRASSSIVVDAYLSAINHGVHKHHVSLFGRFGGM